MDLVNQRKRINQLINTILHNSVCWSCGLWHKGSSLCCDACLDNLPKIYKPCRLCGLSNPQNPPICSQCLYKAPKWQHMVAPLEYDGAIKHLIIELKFHQKLKILSQLTQLVIPYFEHVQDKPEVLVPVPLSKQRYLDRGFNQSNEIAIIIGKYLNIPVLSDACIRIRDTQSQSTIEFKNRKSNIKNAFEVSSELSQFKHIAIVDDVITTGSTVSELTRMCQKQGVNEIDIWVLARTSLKKFSE